MRPGPIERTNRELDEQLEGKRKKPSRIELETALHFTTIDLLTAAWILQGHEEDRATSDHPFTEPPPFWCHLAAQGFEAMELLGIETRRWASAVALRPWTGGER